MSQQEPVGMGADWLDETLTAEIRYQLYSGGSIAVLRFARELRQKHRAFRPDPVGAAMTRDEIIEQCARRLETQKSGSQVYNDICQELASDLRSFKSLSAPPVQAITEAMVMDGQITFEQETGIKTFPYYIRKTLEAAFRVRPAPSDDAQRPTEAAISAVAEMLKRAAPVPELLKKIEQLEALAGGGADHLLASTLAEFREQAIKVMEARADYWANNSQAGICQALIVEECNRAIAAIRALPVPEPWRPIETAPKNGTWFLAGFPEMQPREDYSAYSILRFCDGDWQDEEGTRGYDNFVWTPFDALPALPVPPSHETRPRDD